MLLCRGVGGGRWGWKGRVKVGGVGWGGRGWKGVGGVGGVGWGGWGGWRVGGVVGGRWGGVHAAQTQHAPQYATTQKKCNNVYCSFPPPPSASPLENMLKSTVFILDFLVGSAS